MVQEQTLGEEIVKFAGVAGHVYAVEFEDGIEVVDATNKAVLDLGLDRVPQVAAEQVLEPGSSEVAHKGGRAKVYACLSIFAVYSCVALGGQHAQRCRILALPVEGVAQANNGAQRPSIK